MEINDIIPSFKLKNQNEKFFSSSEIPGKKILLSFHPLAWTSICAQQMKDIETNYSKFEKLNTTPFGFSIDHAPCKLSWAKSLKIKKLNLLCDFWPHGEYSKKLGIFLEEFGFSQRVNIIADENKKIIFFKVYPIKQLPDIAEILNFLKK